MSWLDDATEMSRAAAEAKFGPVTVARCTAEWPGGHVSYQPGAGHHSFLSLPPLCQKILGHQGSHSHDAGHTTFVWGPA